MATVADELLNDFEDSEGEEETDDGLQQDGFLDGPSANGLRPEDPNHVRANGGMELDGDEEEVDDDIDMQGDSAANATKNEQAEDTEETKARVEKMQLGGVSDVRSVAGLMRKLEPVLEVSHPLTCSMLLQIRFTSKNTSPDSGSVQ